jgi:hypothetical protein
MSRAKNEPIGEVDCSHRGCTEKAKVFKFKTRAGDASRTRFAGKLYADCPVHGRSGTDGKQAAQDYILENAKIWGTHQTAPVPAPAAPVKSTESAPVPAPVQPKKKPWWADESATLIK